MKTDIMLDTANLEQIKQGCEFFNISGVTTNPTILKQVNHNDFKKIVNDIIDIIGTKRSLHLQLVGETAEVMIEEARMLKKEFNCNLYVKIPVTKEGLKAIKILKSEGFNITATGILNATQILMAASCGADYMAPYVNRIESIGGNSMEVIKEAKELLDANNLNAKILGASFKNPNQVKDAMLNGSLAITAAYEVIERMIYHPYTDWSLEQFDKDFKDKFDDKKDLRDIL